jgi:hypothetical protein
MERSKQAKNINLIIKALLESIKMDQKTKKSIIAEAFFT